MIEDDVIGDSKNAVAIDGLKNLVAFGIPAGLRFVVVDATVGFDNELDLWTRKVGDERADRSLSSEFESVTPTVSKHCPQRFFGLGWLVSIFASYFPYHRASPPLCSLPVAHMLYGF